MKLCCCVGSLGLYTLFLVRTGVYWCVVGGEYELGVYADGGHIVVLLGMYTHVGGEKCYFVCWASQNRIPSVTVFCELQVHTCWYQWVMCVMVSIILCRTTLTHLYA